MLLEKVFRNNNNATAISKIPQAMSSKSNPLIDTLIAAAKAEAAKIPDKMWIAFYDNTGMQLEECP